jgi:fumarate reductase iron-sulfur subunit
MTTTRTITLSCLRYDPEQDDQPSRQSFEVPFTDDMSVLQGLQYIKDHLDGSLSFRWSCRMAICGSCGVMVNNLPALGCQTFLRDLFSSDPLSGPVHIDPLQHFPIIRDLVIDQTDFLRKLESVKPYVITDGPQLPAAGANKQTPTQVEAYYQFSECINCLLCYAACPQYGLNEDFTGPAALTLLQRWNEDSRDHGRDQRMEVVNGENGVWGCTLVGLCSQVCPKAVDPARAINQNKIASTQDYFGRFLKPRGAA